ncbi:MAG: 2-C-methyl-D-erythritol 2,4-cyclodiphosphate synthase [Candidatus Actinomarinales bacterium]|nr:MAG: 2-C-methyl-D-erythritol 2,4-cyclodiphosphate synthase [Candidatus Actinomarinales bacterium]|tara:strand:- start:2127 stop:2597 length:471 start_codon:yes stop_codon:yes gene_type:complete
MLIGNGWDLHKHSSSEILYLAGLKFEESGFEAYSDGDIILHALCDALLGSVGKKDLGHYFPSKQPTKKDIRSTEMLEKVLKIIEYNKLRVSNIDITIISQVIFVDEKRELLEESISKLLNIDVGKINVKGKTTDNIGLIGDKKASACLVTLLIENA